MKYLCLVYLDAEHWSACSDVDCAEYVQQLVEGRRLLAAEPLHPTHTATTVRVRGGDVTLYDGPFAETREMLAGFYLVDARDLNDAIQLAAKIPPARHGSIEVRPVRELQVDGGAAGERSQPATMDTAPHARDR
ncbi:MAG TPA: YciI family protein [Vicinamibacterales bacterium]|nr:YciI family protein [Vicinamibacterales bacterium]